MTWHFVSPGHRHERCWPWKIDVILIFFFVLSFVILHHLNIKKLYTPLTRLFSQNNSASWYLGQPGPCSYVLSGDPTLSEIRDLGDWMLLLFWNLADISTARMLRHLLHLIADLKPAIIWRYLSTMMTSSNGNIFRVTGPLWGEFAGHRWIPLTKASDADLWCFLWYASWINGSVNNREAGDLRRHRPHYDVIVMRCRDFVICALV